VSSHHINRGSIVTTEHGLYFLATSLGRIQVANKEVMVISTKAPLAAEMLRKRMNDTVSFNGVTHTIQRIE
jgi:transcription elongation GreA/GreB family factor